jgi:enolase
LSRITKIHAREVLDSRGNPTVEVDVHASGDVFGRAIVPSGASTGAAEAHELRDCDAARYDGRGVRRAVAHVNEIIAPALLGMNPEEQQAVDAKLLELDDTPQKTKLGGNSLLGVSLAVAHAGATAKNLPLYQHIHQLFQQTACVPKMPLPMTNMISGGLHAGGNLDFQDVLIMPVGAPDFPAALEWIIRVYRRLGELLSAAGYEGRLVGDEGGYGPRLQDNRQAVEFVVRAIEAAKLRPGEDVTIALDVAATHFYKNGSYQLAAEGDRRLTSSEMIDRLDAWVSEFPITSIEDGLAEDDWRGWEELTRRLGSRVQLVGDDLFATNESRVRRGIVQGVANSVLIKVNQIGTLSETFRTMHAARSAGYTLVVSARSGETEDTTIADLAIGTAAEYIKIGSITRSERLAKYNRLLRIEESLRIDGASSSD